MRKILYSPGYGAGWVSWYYGTDEQKRFMLEYAPFVAFVESGGVFPDDHSIDKAKLKAYPEVQQFLADWTARFPDADKPYLGGLSGLTVERVPDGARVRIDEHDGNESIVVENSEEGWL